MIGMSYSFIVHVVIDKVERIAAVFAGGTHSSLLVSMICSPEL